jgi:hypothetical protein
MTRSNRKFASGETILAQAAQANREGDIAPGY